MSDFREGEAGGNAGRRIGCEGALLGLRNDRSGSPVTVEKVVSKLLCSKLSSANEELSKSVDWPSSLIMIQVTSSRALLPSRQEAPAWEASDCEVVSSAGPGEASAETGAKSSEPRSWFFISLRRRRLYHCRAKINIIERKRNEITMMAAKVDGKVKMDARRADPMADWGVTGVVVDVRVELALLLRETL